MPIVGLDQIPTSNYSPGLLLERAGGVSKLELRDGVYLLPSVISW